MAVTRLRFNAARISASRRDRSTIAPDHTMKKGKELFDFHDTSRRPPRPIQSALDTSPADQEFSSDRSTRARSIGLSDVDLARHRRGDEGCAGFLQAVDCIANMSHDHLGLPSVSVTDFDNRALFFERRQRDLSHIRAAMLPQLLPLLRLGGQEEVTRAPRRPISREGLARNRSFNYVTRQQAEPPVVVLWPPFPVASRRRAIAVGRERLANGRGSPPPRRRARSRGAHTRSLPRSCARRLSRADGTFRGGPDRAGPPPCSTSGPEDGPGGNGHDLPVPVGDHGNPRLLVQSQGIPCRCLYRPVHQRALDEDASNPRQSLSLHHLVFTWSPFPRLRVADPRDHVALASGNKPRRRRPGVVVDARRPSCRQGPLEAEEVAKPA